MKGLFPAYDNLSEDTYRIVWQKSLFVFDTNVLLNLYRYQISTRDELLRVLRRLSDRIWIPHHVALEFQRNRLKVIAEQGRQFSEVRQTIQKLNAGLFTAIEKLQLHNRHSLIKPEQILSGFDKLAADFLKELSLLQESQQKPIGPDPLKAEIETLFDGRVGPPPADQGTLDELYKKAEQRFNMMIPPGYQDSDKDKKSQDQYMHRGIIYKRKYGDYLLWHQLLSHAKASGSKSVILITDDGKEDWWRKVDFEGPKTIGPRPELVEEAAMLGDINYFLMYSPERFLKYAKELLKAQVSEKTLKDVRDISKTASVGNVRHYEGREFWNSLLSAQIAVMEWLLTIFPAVKENRVGFPDFVAERDDGQTFGFELKVVRDPRNIVKFLRDTLYRAYYQLQEGAFSAFTIVFVVSSPAEIDEARHMLRQHIRDNIKDKMPDSLRMIIGVCDQTGDLDASFVPYEDFAYNEVNP